MRQGSFSPELPHLPEKRGGEPGHFLELVGEVGYAAVMQHVRDLRQGVPTIEYEFLRTFNFMPDEKFLNGGAAHFGKKAGEKGVLISKFLADLH